MLGTECSLAFIHLGINVFDYQWIRNAFFDKQILSLARLSGRLEESTTTEVSMLKFKAGSELRIHRVDA